MPTKRLLILANSVKKGQHCVAGREVIGLAEKATYGAWVRPVSRNGEGELTASDCCFEDSTLPRVWDVVNVQLEACENSAAQPENWFIDTERYWEKLGDQPSLGLPAVSCDEPPDLWMDSDSKQDRISVARLAALNRPQSLYLVAVTDFHLKIDWHSMRGVHRRRATFRYRGQYYDLSVTDPEMNEHFGTNPASGSEKMVELPTGKEKVLCVSLTPPFNGDHYKVVATVLEIAK